MQNQPQSALVLIKSGRFKTLFRLRADDDDSYMSAICQIAGIRLVEDNDQQSILLKNRAGDQRRNVLLQPGVSDVQSDTQGGIVSVMQQVRDDKGKVRQLVVGQIRTKLREGDEILDLRAASRYIGEIRQNIVALCVRMGVAPV